MSGVLQGLIGSLKSAAAAATDAYFNLTTLLLNTSSTNGAQNNTFLDSSTNNFSITRNGNTTQGTFTPFSQTGWSNNFSSSYLTIADNAALDFAGDFTFECWVYSLASNSSSIYEGYQNGLAVAFSSGTIKVNQSFVAELLTDSAVMALNTWNHIVVSRSGTTLSLFRNGVRTATATNSTSFNTNSANYIGQNGQSVYFSGYISNLRIVKGTAVYDPTLTTLTVPTTPLTAITNTSLLTCQSNRFVDNSTNAFALTPNGTPSVQAFSPFAPTAAYDAAVVGGSGYFDGSGDYLETASNAAFNIEGGAYTIEGWVYFNSISTGQRIVVLTGSSSTYALIVGTSSTNNLEVNQFGTGTVITATNALVGVTKAWAHVCVVSNGTNRSIFVNGTRYATSTSAFFQASNNAVGIGGVSGTYSGSNPDAYFSGFRIVKGTAVYDPTLTTLTLPTAPPTAVTNTALLLNYTNSGIFDSTAKNVYETVSTAAASTAQAKWGTTSMVFNGTSDYIVNPSSALVSAWGSGDFTVEGWYYSNSISASISPLWTNSTSSSDGMNILDLSNTGILSFGKVGVNSFSSASGLWSNGNWYHVAVVRSGATIYIYLNGVSIASGAASTYLEASTVKPITLGRNYQSSSVYYDGYIDEFRVTKGYARYPNGTTFTPPTAAFPTQ